MLSVMFQVFGKGKENSKIQPQTNNTNQIPNNKTNKTRMDWEGSVEF